MAKSARLSTLLVLLGGVALAACADDSSSAGDGDGTGSSGGDESPDDGTTVGEDETGPGEGEAPPVPQLVSPQDGAVEVGEMVEETVTTELCWEPVEDPEGLPVRYRVWVDDVELTEGKLEEEPGWPGPCLGPLNFNFEQQYTWQVSAFTPEFPDSESDRSEAWSFTTRPNGLSTPLFEDDFEEDLGWTVSGDANGGEWVLGDPTPAEYEGQLSQPDDCAGADGCYFTGENIDGMPNIADVRGGTTMLTSPPIDMSEVEVATVQLSRFFFKSEFPETGTLFRVELLVPNDEAPDGFDEFVLEQLEAGEEVGNANQWTPTEYTTCGLPMVEDARLRVIATDLGEGILEAAIDNVLVTGFFDDAICEGGVGAVCDPNAADPCGEGLLCCGQGVVDKGVFRCAQPVPGLTFPDPGIDFGDAPNGPMGCDAPDLFATELGMDTWEDDLFVPEDSCVLFEGCVGGPGQRHLLRFDTITPNMGSRDLVMGVPTNHPDLFVWSDCHQHYHFDGYAVYTLLDEAGEIVANGHKQAFCLIDWNSWAWPQDTDNQYTCSNQGIQMGWQDVYGGNLDCNWIDITGVAPGNYTLRIAINPPNPATGVPPLVERDYSNNVLEVPVSVAG